MNKYQREELWAIEQIAKMKLDANGTMFAHMFVIIYTFLRTKLAEEGRKFEDLTMPEILEIVKQVPTPFKP